MRIFFVGTISFSKVALEKLLFLNANIVGVATKSQSTFNADHVDLSSICIEEDIPWKYVKDVNAPHIQTWIKSLKPDIIFCFGWSNLIKKELLDLTEIGVVGFHPTELPKNRGRHPVIWSLVLGLDKSATTFFFMKEGADDGDILSQSEFTIAYEDDAFGVYEKIVKNALLQIEHFLPKLQRGDYKLVKQDESQANLWRKRGVKDGEIDFRMSSFAIYNLVRALTRPYIGAHINYQGEEVKIWKVKEENCTNRNIEPGKVLRSDDLGILVKTYDGAVRILEHTFKKTPNENEYL